VQSNGSLIAAGSKNVTSSVSSHFPNIYCLTVSAQAFNGVASVDFGTNSSAGFADVSTHPLDNTALMFFGCPGGTNALVETFSSAGASTAEAFFVAFFG
jgi:hypothetical protein